MKSATTASAHTVTALPDTCLMIVRRPGAATTGWDAEGAPPGKSWREGKTASHSRARAGIEAGYPDGFGVTLDCANDWGDDEIATCAGVAEQLGKIGIDVAINFLSTDGWDKKVFQDRQSDFYIDGRDMNPIPRGY